MADDVAIRIALLNAGRAIRESRQVSASLSGIGAAGAGAGRRAGAGLAYLASRSREVALAGGIAAAAFTKMGLDFNSTVENSLVRFDLFTRSQEESRRLFEQIGAIDKNSTFGLDVLTETAALLGGAGVDVTRLPKAIQALANTAASAGKGQEAVQGMAIAYAQLQGAGVASMEEVNQLVENGAFGFKNVLRRELDLTSEDFRNLGAQGIKSTRVLEIFNKWATTGRMGEAARRQTETFSGQIDAIQSTVQRAMGGLTRPMFETIRDEVLPGVQATADQVAKIFADDNLSSAEKSHQAREVVTSWARVIEDEFDIGGNFSRAVEAGMPVMMNAAGKAAPAAAGAFVEGWLSAGVWGKLITAGFLLGKMGAFSAVGGMVARRYFAPMFAASAATAIPAQLNAQKPQLRGRLLKFGGWIGLTISAGIALQDFLEGKDDAIPGRQGATDSSLRNDRTRRFTPGMREDINRRYPGTFPAPRRRMPNEQRQTGPGGGTGRISTQRIAVQVDGREIGHAVRRDGMRRRARG